MKPHGDSSGDSGRDDFLLGVIHDLRAYLRASMTGSQLLQRTAGAEALEAIREQLALIVSANRQMDRFLSRLADYANATQAAPGRTIPLEAALQSAMLQFPGLAAEIEAEPAELLQHPVTPNLVRVFQELMDNALKFSSNGPVAVRAVADGEGRGISVIISDEGTGLKEDEMEMVFEPLTKLHSSSEYPGYGLGLAICRRTAATSGATVHLSASAAGGVDACVMLPASE